MASNIANAHASLPCAFCKTIVPDGRRRTDNATRLDTLFERQDVYPTYPSVESSAQAGCDLCLFMLKRLTSKPSDVLRSIQHSSGRLVWERHEKQTKQLATPWDQKIIIRASFDFFPFSAVVPTSNSVNHGGALVPQTERQHGGAVTSLRLRCQPTTSPLPLADGNIWDGEEFEFPVFDSIDLHSPYPECRRELPSLVTLSDRNVSKIKKWVDECLNNHTQCWPSPDTENWLPSRLLEIDSQHDELQIKLVESLDYHLEAGIRFAALSHVWGNMNTSPLRLLLSNIDAFKIGIKECELPKTFLDAARVCARLGIQYLWVDSLCIIQDSLGDWSEQAILMHLIYRHALVTIVATSVTSCHDGFLKRTINSVPTIKVAYSISSASQISPSEDMYMIIYDYDNPQDSLRMFAVNGSMWNTRAWTMQERSLSTRMVHFCRNKIFFECRGCLLSEENEPAQEPDSISSILWPRGEFTSYEELYQHWQLFVGEYTSRRLTVSSDRLPAIQSIAEEMAIVTGQEYIQLAGMWRPNLWRELLWYPLFGTANRLDVWRAPSWSWAAVEGQISLWQRNFRHSHQAPQKTLLSCLAMQSFEVLDVDRGIPDPQVTYPGFLKVKSLMREFHHIQKHDGSSGDRHFFPHDLIIYEFHLINGTSSRMEVFAHGRLDIDHLVDPSNAFPTTPRKFMYLHINNNGRATGLILQAQTYSQGQNPTAWVRIGIATLFWDRSDKPILNDAFHSNDVSQTAILI